MLPPLSDIYTYINPTHPLPPFKNKKETNKERVVSTHLRLPTPNLNNIIPINKNLLLIQTRLDGAFLLKDDGQLLERALTRLDEQKVNHSHFERAPEDKQEVVLPPGARECDSRHKGVVEGGDVYEELNVTQRY
jgi:hypothetical protein